MDDVSKDALINVLKFYGDRENWVPHFVSAEVIPGQVYTPPEIKVDGGQSARDILRKVGVDLPDEIAP